MLLSRANGNLFRRMKITKLIGGRGGSDYRSIRVVEAWQVEDVGCQARRRCRDPMGI